MSATKDPSAALEGVVAYDRKPPAGSESFVSPTLSVGDRFVLRRGGIVQMEYEITSAELSAEGKGYELTERASGLVIRYTPELWELGQRDPAHPGRDRHVSPADPSLHWPLWVGKRWRAQIMRHAEGAQVAVEVRYEVEAYEKLRVPAGSIMALRIRRTALPIGVDGRFIEQTTLHWYSPEVGFYIRRLEHGTLLELESWHRQQR